MFSVRATVTLPPGIVTANPQNQPRPTFLFSYYSLLSDPLPLAPIIESVTVTKSAAQFRVDAKTA
jgi:hypothetical protein